MPQESSRRFSWEVEEAVKTKLELVIEIVDWEHRYKLGRLQSAEWALNRVKELMELSKPEVLRFWKQTFQMTNGVER